MIKLGSGKLFDLLVQNVREEEMISHETQLPVITLPNGDKYVPACRVANCLYDWTADEASFAAYEACFDMGYHLKVMKFKDRGRVIYDFAPDIPTQFDSAIKAVDEEEDIVEVPFDSSVSELYDKVERALVQNSVDQFDLVRGQVVAFIKSDVGIAVKHELLRLVKGFKLPDGANLEFAAMLFRVDLLKRAYYIVFDSSFPFRVNIPCLEFFFESATRVGVERNELMIWCQTIYEAGMSYNDAELLVDLVPVCELKDKILDHLRATGDKKSHLTYHSDAQSVHNKGVVDSTLRAMGLVQENDKSAQFEQMRDAFVHRVGGRNLNKAQKNALRIIDKDVSAMNLRSAFCHIWSRIIQSEYREELTTRLLEELNEMNDKCKSGHLSRLVNVLVGFDAGEDFQTKISYDDEIKAAFLARFECRINKLPDDEKETFLANMVDADKTPEYVIFKETVRYDLYEELKAEYQPLFDKIFDEAAFDSAYAAAVNSV